MRQALRARKYRLSKCSADPSGRGEKMKILIVYCHPSNNSLTKRVSESFIKGVIDSGNEYEISDLYKMNFNCTLSEKEYLRESNYLITSDLSEDVLIEQKKLNNCDAITFIYPLFWTDTPAILKGWFDRVWTFGFAYGIKSMKTLKKALIICIAGHTVDNLEKFGFIQSIKNIMIGDRIKDRANFSDFVIYGNTTKQTITSSLEAEILNDAYIKGKTFFIKDEKYINLDGKNFCVLENSKTGEVSSDTVFSYHQKDGIIWAEYQGGDILKGNLLGKIENNNLEFTYQHINGKKEQKQGKCISVVEVLNNKYRLLENWEWISGEKGHSILQEI